MSNLLALSLSSPENDDSSQRYWRDVDGNDGRPKNGWFCTLDEWKKKAVDDAVAKMATIIAVATVRILLIIF